MMGDSHTQSIIKVTLKIRCLISIDTIDSAPKQINNQYINRFLNIIFKGCNVKIKNYYNLQANRNFLFLKILL